MAWITTSGITFNLEYLTGSETRPTKILFPWPFGCKLFHRAQLEEGRSRDSFCSKMTVLDKRVLGQRSAAVPTAKVVNVDLLRAKLAEAAAERDNFRGWK